MSCTIKLPHTYVQTPSLKFLTYQVRKCCLSRSVHLPPDLILQCCLLLAVLLAGCASSFQRVLENIKSIIDPRAVRFTPVPVPAMDASLDGRTHTIVRLQTRTRRKDGTENFEGFVYVLDGFLQRDFLLWVFMCSINFSLFFWVSFPATTPRATTPVQMHSS